MRRFEPIAGDDVADEEKRWDAFLEELENPPDPEDSDEDPLELAFDEDLIALLAPKASQGIKQRLGWPVAPCAIVAPDKIRTATANIGSQ